MALFRERGFGVVTVAEIAERAGLTKRSFFNHFPDKREVLFAGAAELESRILRGIARQAPHLAPLDVVLSAFAEVDSFLEPYLPYAAERRTLIDSTPELIERDAMKNVLLGSAISGALERRGCLRPTARMTAHAGVMIFAEAFAAWSGSADEGFATVLDRTRSRLLEVMQGGAATGSAGSSAPPPE